MPIAVTPEEEKPADIQITGGGVKGPLINAEVNIYKLELDKGEIHEFNAALKKWFELLEENEVSITGDEVSIGSVSESDIIDNLKESIQQFGFTTEIKKLKKDVASATSFTEANTKVTSYLEGAETNAKLVKRVEAIKEKAATLADYKSGIKAIESLTDELEEVESFSAARSLLVDYRANEKAAEPDVNQLTPKQAGFDAAIASLDAYRARANSFGLTAIRNAFEKDIHDVFLQRFDIQNSPFSRQNIIDLKASLSEANSIEIAKEALEKGFNKESNLELKAALSMLTSKITTLDDFKFDILGRESIYHNYTVNETLFNSEPEAPPSDEVDKIKLVNTQFVENLEPALRASFIVEDDNEEKLNLLSFGVTNEQGLLPGLFVGQYRGFVYMEVKSLDKTIDLNSGKAPIVKKLETIFHTDSILGNSETDGEDKTLYFILDGQVQRDSDGKLITDRQEIESEGSIELLEIRPTFLATPLTHLGVGVTIEKLKSLNTFKADANLDGNPDSFLTSNLLKSSLKDASQLVVETLGIGMPEDQSIFNTPAIRLPELKYFEEQELAAIQYRLSLENFSAFIQTLKEKTNLTGQQILDLLRADLSDNQLDGKIYTQAIQQFSAIPEYKFLLVSDPSEKFLPDTNIPVSDIFYVMNDELSTTQPEHELSAFAIKRSDMLIHAPKGGLDSDSDGVLDNEDQFPSDPLKSRDLEPGYAGIWSIGFDSSEYAYMPFKNDLVFALNKEVIQGACTNLPCIGLGNLSTDITAEYSLIQAPANHDFIYQAFDTNDSIGFSAFATVPGNYLIKATFESSQAPIQEYEIIIPVQVIDPKAIELRFNPEIPEPGKKVVVEFKVTKGLCALYAFCNELNINLDDNLPDYVNISYLADIFSVNQHIIRDSQQLGFTIVDSIDNNNELANLSNLRVNDKLSVSVKFSAGNREFIAKSTDSNSGGTIDSDSDGVADTDDVFPNDANCALEKDGILDTNFDGEINNLDTPTCFASLIADATDEVDVLFLNETWHFNSSWHYIVREKKYESGFNGFIKLPTLSGRKQAIEDFIVDDVSKRVYFAYKDASIDYFSLENQTISEFTSGRDFTSIKSLNLIGTYLLVEYGVDEASNEGILYNANGNVAQIKGAGNFPKPLAAINLEIDGLNFLSSTKNLLKIDWQLERENPDQTVSIIPVQVSNDSTTLLSGQTLFGDVIKLSFTYTTDDDREIKIEQTLFVLNVDDIKFTEEVFFVNQPLTINLVNFDASVLSDSNQRLFVNWSKNGESDEEFRFSLRDTSYPFILEASNFVLGDMIKADVMLKHGEEELPVKQLNVVILGDLSEILPIPDPNKTTVDIANLDVHFELMEAEPSSNNDFFTLETFLPVWRINGVIIEGENGLIFPQLDTTTFSYGDQITVSYSININGQALQTDVTLVGELTLDTNLSRFTLQPKVAEIGQDISLVTEHFTEDLLATLEPKWRINSELDESETTFTYPSSKLKYGDFVELLLVFEGGQVNNAFNHIAEASVGLNLFSLQQQVNEPLLDLDSDQDGIANNQDFFRYDPACSLITEGNPDDLDGDGLADLRELSVHQGSPNLASPNIADTDKDGLSDWYELTISLTDPLIPDTDGDGYLDGVEIDLGTDPLDALSPNNACDDDDFDGLCNEAELAAETEIDNFDTDGDGLSDWFELNISLTDPLNPDSDNDGIADGLEVRFTRQTNPNIADTDKDGLSDWYEVNISHTDPLNPDTDGDGYLDGVEINLKTDPLDPLSPNAIVADNDFDGLSNDGELSAGTKVNVFDTDADGLSDWYEIKVSLTDPLNPDSDSDGLSDGLEILVTKTDPLNADTDNDGLSDGLEVLLGLNPLLVDSDNNGANDSAEPGFDFSQQLPGILYVADLPNYTVVEDHRKTVPAGTCFNTFIADEKPQLVTYSHVPQVSSLSEQQVAFTSSDWSQVLRYDAKNKQYLQNIDLSAYTNVELTSLEYDVNDLNTIYLGFSDGAIRKFEAQTNAITDFFIAEEGFAVTKLLDQGSLLLAEQVTGNAQIVHSAFVKPPINTIPSDSTALAKWNANYSYKQSVWFDDNRNQLFIIDSENNPNVFIRETFDSSQANPLINVEQINSPSALNGPVLIESIEANEVLRFGSGQSYNLSSNAWLSQQLAPFSYGLSHQSHRVVALKNSSFLEMTTLSTINGDKFWRFTTQLEQPEFISVIPVGFHLLAITSKSPKLNEPSDIAFQTIILGDEDDNDLPDWWQRLSSSLTLTEFNNYQLTSDVAIPDFLNGNPDIDDSVSPPVLVDTDGDGICDHWETTLFGTNPLSIDTDNDGVSDAKELGIIPQNPLDCSVRPQFSMISDPTKEDTDGDGLSDGDEPFTDVLNPDTDGDGLTDWQESVITKTDPLSDDSNGDGTLDGAEDSDKDGLSDAQELNIYHTDPFNVDTDGDGLSDFDEVMLHGSNPNLWDSDGDLIPDGIEVGFVEIDGINVEFLGTSPSRADTDGDGLSDSDEVWVFAFEVDDQGVLTENLLEFDGEEFNNKRNDDQWPQPVAFEDNSNDSNTKKDKKVFDLFDIADKDKLIGRLFVQQLSDPKKRDTDGDGLTDKEEFDFLYAYPDVLLGLFQELEITPATRLNLTSNDTDGDGICDVWEVTLYGTNPAEADTDFDGLTDAEELGIIIDSNAPIDCINPPQSNPISNALVRDTDEDGVLDGDEVNRLFTDPRDTDSNDSGITDDKEDFDGDGLTNAQELYITLTDPFNPDTNGNGVIDSLDDEDGDGLSNIYEINTSKTNPLKFDTNDNGLSDKEELDLGLDPIKEDTDDDGISDVDEISLGTDPLNPDTDNDGSIDGDEISLTKRTDPLNPDSDHDFLKDGADGKEGLSPLNWDTDGDGIPDGIEVHYLGTTPAGPDALDSDGDGLADSDEVWVFAFKVVDGVLTDDFVKVGVDLNVNLNNKQNHPLWPQPVAFTDNGLDRRVHNLYDMEDNTKIIGRLFIQMYSNPAKADTDGDGLLDSTEFAIETAFGNGFDLTLTSGRFLPLLSNAKNFKVSDPWNVDSNSGKDNDGDGLPDWYELKATLTDPLKADSDDNGIPDGLENPDDDLLNNLQEMLYGSDPRSFDDLFDLAGLSIVDTDTDGDGLPDLYELNVTNTSPTLVDTDDNGISDADEDLDNDGMSNILEYQLTTNPNVANFGLDSDGDGLTDFQEINLTLTDPFLRDSNNNGILDGDEDPDNDGISNIVELLQGSDPLSLLGNEDSDSDGLTDYQEINITNTDPFNRNSLSTDLTDAEFDSDMDGLSNALEIRLGLNPLVSDADSLIKDSDNDGLSDSLELLLGSDPTVRNYSVDTDGDGLTDFQETAITLTDINLLDSNSNGILDGNEDFDGDSLTNLQEMLLLNDPYVFDILDGQEDIDGDLLVNILDQNNQETDILNADTDGDGILDGIEVLILGTNPGLADTDGDGISDRDEVDQLIVRDVASNEACLDTETRLSNIAGKDYCITVLFNSYPTLTDSDNDGTPDRVVNEDDSVTTDHFPLDASCHKVTDGFENLDIGREQCFSSWMSGFESIDRITSAEWLSSASEEQAEVIFHKQGWDKVVRYNILTESFFAPVSVDTDETVLAIDTVSLTKSLYILYGNGKLDRFDLEAGTTQTIGTFAHAGLSPSTLLAIDTGEVILQFVDASNQSSLYLYDQNGVQLDVLSGLQVDIEGGLFRCDSDDCGSVGNIFSFIIDANGLITNLASIGVDLQTKTFGSIVSSNTLSQFSELKGPIRLSQADDKIYLGSGQILELDLQDSDHTQNLSIAHSGKTYSEYYDFAEISDHFIGIVDVDLSGIPNGDNLPSEQNGMLVKEQESIKISIATTISDNAEDPLSDDALQELQNLKELNQYLVIPTDFEEQILKLSPFARNEKPEVAVIKKTSKGITIKSLGLLDSDGDLMTDLYENLFGLDANSANDQFLDLDEDGLANVEEYFFATDPSVEDTDQDGWDDLYEVLNGTDPLDALSF